MREGFIAGLAVLLLPTLGAADSPEELQAFLKNYCIKCHGSEKQKGDRRFDALKGDLTLLEEAEAFQEILDQLNLAEMPPEDELQPDPDELRRVVAHLTEALAVARENAKGNTW